VIACDVARELLLTSPERTLYSVMGRGATDIQDELKLFPFRIAGDSEGSESVPPASAGKPHLYAARNFAGRAAAIEGQR
jgi:hypothetical protein